MDAIINALADALETAAKKNPGPAHETLLADIRALRDKIVGIVHEAEDLEFHDYANTKYALPKIELHHRLEVIGREASGMMKKVCDGDYDDPDPLPNTSVAEAIAKNKE